MFVHLLPATPPGWRLPGIESGQQVNVATALVAEP